MLPTQVQDLALHHPPNSAQSSYWASLGGERGGEKGGFLQWFQKLFIELTTVQREIKGLTEM